MAMLTPKYKASHNFGFMSMINRLAGFLGPFIFSTLSFLYDAKTGFIGSRPPLPLRPSLSAFLTPPPSPPPNRAACVECRTCTGGVVGAGQVDHDGRVRGCLPDAN